MKPRKSNSNSNVSLIIAIAAVSLVFGISMFLVGVVKFPNPNGSIQSQSFVESDIVYVESNQTVADGFINALDNAGIPVTERFTIQTDAALFDSSGKKYSQSSLFSKELQKLTLLDDAGHLLDKGNIQVTFTGLGTRENKNIEVKATAIFYLDDESRLEKKLYAKGTTENNKIKLYITDSFAEPPLAQRKYDSLFTLANEGQNWGQNTEHHFKIILKDITFTNFVTGEVWAFYGEETAYDLKMTVDQNKEVILDPAKLDEAISIFKRDNEFKTCSGGGTVIVSTGGYGGSTTPAEVPEVKLTVDGKYYDTIPAHLDGKNAATSQPGLQSGSISGEDACKSVMLPRNAEVVATIKNNDYKFFTPKAKQEFYVKCSNIPVGVGSVYYGGSYRPTSYDSKYACGSSIGFEFP